MRSLDSYSALLGGRSVKCVFYRKNSILIVRATLRPLFEEVVGKLMNSEAASLSSPHA